LDLGSGAGRDCFITQKLVGEKGKVVGVDMTEEQILVANKYISYHTQLFGYSAPNVSFVKVSPFFSIIPFFSLFPYFIFLFLFLFIFIFILQLKKREILKTFEWKETLSMW